jgi:hypothetical protein
VRRLRLHTDHGDDSSARAVAAAVAPDNTDEMTTSVDGSTVVTTIERETTGSLLATADDYVVNLRTAAQLTTDATTHTDSDDTQHT